MGRPQARSAHGFAARAAWRWTRRLPSGDDRTLAPSSSAAAALAAHGIPRVHRWARGVDTAHCRPSRRDEQLRAQLAPHGELLDVFGHTGPFETFCQTVQEALASGLPVIAPDASGPRDLVVPGRIGFLLPETGKADADKTFGNALRGAVLALADDPELRTRYGTAARRSVLRRTWPTLCDELLGHYAEVTGLPADAWRVAVA